MKTKLLLALTLLSTFNIQLSTLFAQGTAFTYQGRLSSNGVPVNGTYDLLFTIYASATGTNDDFANYTNATTVVSNGLFTANLNLGLPGIFTGEDRWLEIEVRTNGPGPYAKLGQRQKITATPYAITAGNLSGTISAGQLSGAIPLAQLPAAVVTNNQSGVNISGTFTGNGGSLSNLNSENLAGPLTVAADLVSLGHSYDGGFAYGVAVSGNFAYLANYDDGLRVYNIANPANPVSIGHINDGGTAQGVAVSGNFAYLANYLDGLRVYNIANPANPVSIGHINDGGRAQGVAVSGNFAYVANYDDGLRVYNIANPTNPVSIGHIDDGGLAWGVAVSGNFAYLANYIDGLRVYNIANPTNPVSIGHIDDGGAAFGVAVSGNFAYLANYNDGLRVYNVANPTNPVSIGHSYYGGLAGGVAVSGNFAYLASNADGLRVYSIANPANPVSIGHIDDGGLAGGVTVSGNFAYLANYNDGLRVYGLGGVASALAFRGNGSLLTGLNADNITSGTLNAARIPNLDASKITTGTIGDARLSANVALRAGGNAFTGNQTITSGNVGIGVSVPQQQLSVGAGLNIDQNNGNSGTVANALTFGSSSGEGIASKRTAGGNQFGLDFYTASFNRLSIANNGNVGIGTLNPASSLQVNGGIRARGGPPGPDGNANNGYTFGAPGDDDSGLSSSANGQLEFYSNSAEVMRIASGGNVGIGTNNPNQKLVVQGNIYATGTITPNSDRNLKTNFAPVDVVAVLDQVARLPIQQWRFKAEPDGVKHFGPMAQDFRAAFGLGEIPTAITTVDADGVALAAIQGLNQKLEETRSELKRKDAEIAELRRAFAEFRQSLQAQPPK